MHCVSPCFHCCCSQINTLRPRQNGRYFPEDIVKCILLNEHVGTLLNVSLNFVSDVRIKNLPALVQIMALCRPGDKPLSWPMMIILLTHTVLRKKQNPGSQNGVGGAVRFLVVGTIGQGERPPRGQLWMEQCLTSLKYWPIQYTIWADPNYTWGLAILADSLLFFSNNILAGLWINCISSVEITLFLLADILLQHRALFQC